MLWLAVFTPLVLAGAVLYLFGAAAPAILSSASIRLLALLAGAAAAYLTHRSVKNSASRAGASTKRRGYATVVLVVGFVVMQTVENLSAVLEEAVSRGSVAPVSELIWLAVMVAACGLGVLAARQFLTPAEVEGNQNVEA